MTSILSAISGHFGKTLVFGTVIPVVLFVVLGWVFVSPLYPDTLAVLAPLHALDTEWKAVVFTLVIVIFSGFLFHLNNPLIRLYEGYSWQDSWFGQYKTRRYQREYLALESRLKGMRTMLRQLPANSPDFKRLHREWVFIDQKVNAEFPRNEDLILPTRLGNVMRSFEDYPYRQYGMESINLWPRLIAVMDKEYAAAIDDAKVSFDFTLNISALSFLLTFICLFTGLAFPLVFASPAMWIPWVGEMALLFAIGCWFYLLLLGRTRAWGDMFRACFDLFRWDLLKKLGFRFEPNTLQEERFLWRDIHQQLIYGDTPTILPADYNIKRVIALPEFNGIPVGGYLKTARGIGVPDTNGCFRVSIRITNADPRGRAAKNVTVTDNVPDGFSYEWRSASRTGYSARPEVVGDRVLQFSIGDIASAGSAEITYRVIPYSKK